MSLLPAATLLNRTRTSWIVCVAVMLITQGRLTLLKGRRSTSAASPPSVPIVIDPPVTESAGLATVLNPSV